MTDDRNPHDGRPYYCVLCGVGYGEFLACEEPDCRLESDKQARERQGTQEQTRWNRIIKAVRKEEG